MHQAQAQVPLRYLRCEESRRSGTQIQDGVLFSQQAAVNPPSRRAQAKYKGEGMAIGDRVCVSR